MLLAGLRRWYGFAEASLQIPLDWKRFVARLPLDSQVSEVTFGATCAADMGNERFEYMCAVEVETFGGLRPDVGRMRVPEATYAVFVHEGPVSDIRRTVVASHSWLATNGEWMDGGTPTFERYGAEFDLASGTGDITLWLPVISAAG